MSNNIPYAGDGEKPPPQSTQLDAFRGSLIRMFERKSPDGVNDDVATLRAIANCLSPEANEHFASDGSVEWALVMRLRTDDALVHAFYTLAFQFDHVISDAKL